MIMCLISIENNLTKCHQNRLFVYVATNKFPESLKAVYSATNTFIQVVLFQAVRKFTIATINLYPVLVFLRYLNYNPVERKTIKDG